MSKPRFSLYAEIDTLAHANTIKTNIQTQLAGKDLFEIHGFSTFVDILDGKNKIFADWRFNNFIDRDALKNWAQDQIQNHPQVKVWVLKAKLSWHECSHSDLEVKNCRTTSYAEFLK